jgi:hypothetical protein
MILLKKAAQSLCFISTLLYGAAAFAADITGPVQRLHVADDGTLWFAMDTTVAQTYCKPGWHALTMYIPANHPQYQYYYGMLLTAVAKGRGIYVGNISHYNGTVACDVTKTGYGIVLLGA